VAALLGLAMLVWVVRYKRSGGFRAGALAER